MPPNGDTVNSLYYENGRQGFVYCLTHPAMPGLIKVGATRKHPLQRMKELGASTGVPGDFNLSYYRDFADAFTAETLVHERFDHCRVTDSREFFEAPLSEVVDYIDGLGASSVYQELISQGVTGGDYATPPRAADTIATPWADLFATFPDDGSPRELTAAERAQCDQLRQAQKQS